MNDIDPVEAKGLAMFLAGEAWFHIGSERGPMMGCELRADDADILRYYQALYGGRLHSRDRSDEFGRERERPTVTWRVGTKEDLLRLVEVIGNRMYPAKKHFDFMIWRDAVRIYYRKGGTASELPALKAELENVRKYDAPAYEPPAPEPLPMEAFGLELA